MKECKVCGESIETTPTSRGADYYLCPRHSSVLNDSPREQFLLRNVAQQVARGQVEHGIDTTGVRYFRRLEPQAPPQRPVSYDDDGTPRFLSTSSPHGQTFRPGVDRCFGGSDERLSELRDAPPEGDDNAE
jgi:hypothetical protein